MITTIRLIVLAFLMPTLVASTNVTFYAVRPAVADSDMFTDVVWVPVVVD
jgi:hypothetical protein